jgi:hypothetical protein
MKLSSSLKKVESWLDGDVSKPENRFVNLDGTQHGTRGLHKLLTNPSLKASLVLGVFAATAKALTQPQAQQAHTLLVQFAWNAGFMIASQAYTTVVMKKYVPVKKDSVIDKAGYGGDVSAAAAMSAFYRANFNYFSPFLLGLCILNGPAGIIRYAMYKMPDLWFKYAQHKLDSNQWTIHKEPPKVEVRAKSPVRKMAEATVGTRRLVF